MIVTLPKLLQLTWAETGPGPSGWFPPSVPDSVLEVHAAEPVEYADPVAVAMVGAWAAQWSSLGVRIDVHDSVKSPYAWKSGLLSALAGRFGRIAAPERQVQAHLREQTEIESLLGKLGPVLHLPDPATTEAAQYCLSELLRNVFEHSGSVPGAFVGVGYFPKTDRVTIGVVDLGMTVPKHVSRRWPSPVDPREALSIALEPGASGSIDRNRNAGLGLYMTRRLVALMGGKFWLYTGGLRARDDGELEPGRRTTVVIEQNLTVWNGTCVGLTFHPNRIASYKRELATLQDELAGGTAGRRIDLFRKHPPAGATIIRVAPDASTLAQNKLRAEEIRTTEILPALRRGEVVSLDFAGVSLTTQSYMHALLAEVFRELGLEHSMGRVFLVAASHQVKQVARIVAGYVLDELSD
jgi:hypothetical protein